MQALRRKIRFDQVKRHVVRKDGEEQVYYSLSETIRINKNACWLGSRLWQELGPDEFFSGVSHDRRGSVEWAKVIELLAVNRLVAPESELGVHQRWYATTAMDVVLGTDDAVASKVRLYRALDQALEHKEALERHLAQHWRDLIGAKCDLLLYDLTSSDFEGQAGEIPVARGRPLSTATGFAKSEEEKAESASGGTELAPDGRESALVGRELA